MNFYLIISGLAIESIKWIESRTSGLTDLIIDPIIQIQHVAL